jgi:hypothetical protein
MPEPDPSRRRLHLATDALLASLLIGLAFLLGCFRQIDMDIWWHLKAGQEILRRGEIPRTDWFTFTSTDRAWIDLHWLFQIGAARLYALGGMKLLTLASATLGAVAVATLLAARRRGWPVAWQVAAWLPAIVLLGGRLYVRPEVVTLVCLAAFLAILFHAEQRPRLLGLLLPIQLLWVNVQGLFILGPAVYALFVFDGVMRPVLRQPRANVSRRILLGAALGGVCLLNPYGWSGLIFPLELFGKMSWDAAFYSEHIAELQSIRQFVAAAGIGNFYVQLHFFVLALGAVSFVFAWSRGRYDLFRLLTFLAFAWLGLQATRNSGQYALVAGAVTAWNSAEWAAARRPNRADASRPLAMCGQTILAATMLVACWAIVSGRFYALAGEGRVFGLGEQPFWHAHDAARFAAQPGMPDRLIAFHLGHAANFEFHKRDEQRTFCDPRLEVVSRELLAEYHAIERAIAEDQRGWEPMLARHGLEMVLVDHRGGHALEATLLSDADWRCVHFDAVASVFLLAERAESAGLDAVDFTGWHFESAREAGRFTPANRLSRRAWSRPRLAGDPAPAGKTREFVLADAFYRVARDVSERRGDPDLRRILAQLSFDHARAGAMRYAAAAEGWRFMGLGLLLQLDDPPVPSDLPPDGWFDLSARAVLELARVKFLLDTAVHADASDFASLSTLYGLCGLDRDAFSQIRYARELMRRPRTKNERTFVDRVRSQLGQLQQESAIEDAAQFEATSSPAPMEALEQRVNEHLSRGWVRAALREFASVENQYAGLPSPLVDKLGALLLRADGPGKARGFWERRMSDGFDSGLAHERIAMTFLIECDYDAAIEHFQSALSVDATRVASRSGLMRCYLETGDAAGVLRESEAALADETFSENRRRELETMRDWARPFAVPTEPVPSPRERD